MPNYTNNYQMLKPTYAELANIQVINDNFEKTDDIMHKSQISLAPAYDQSQTYAEGDVVMYELLMYKCISPTTGVWDGSKWERTTASESGGGGSAELDILGEGNGAVVSFADGASAELAKCVAEIVPKQDLHGYNKPWAGGAGKNKLPFNITDIKAINTGGTWTGNDYAINNVVVSVLTDTDGNIAGFKYNGTANAAFGFNLTANNLTLPSGSYIWSIQETVDINNLWVSIYNPNSAVIVAKTQTAVNYTCNGSFGGAYIYTNSGNTFDNVVFQPMLRLSSETDATFEPYSNICPISGSTSVTVTVSDGETSTTKTTPLGQTVYGGQLNVLTGELTIDRVYLKLTSDLFTAFNNTLKAGFTDGNYLGQHIMACNALAPSYSYSTVTDTISVRTQDGRIIAVPSWASECTDLASFKTAYANQTELEVVHTITPQTVQLTPREVNSLLGQNNISADTGDIDIVYVKASAPIQPNPTGTPTATLKKLGIEGTVFELEGGGGGSSLPFIYDSNERVVGSWFGQTLYQKTFDLGNTMTFENGWKTVIPHYNEYALVMGGELLNTGGIAYSVDIACNDSTYIEIFASHQLQGRYLTFKYTKNTN